jgi:XTP/dITP diphosphohydrolase
MTPLLRITPFSPKIAGNTMPGQHKELLIATNNPGKVAELKDLLAKLPVELLCLLDFNNIIEAEETGLTFSENAQIKARSYAAQTGVPALADDSGLEVEALDGRPGVLSARYGGEETSFSEKITRLLKELGAAHDVHRRASFSCSIAVADSTGKILRTVTGVCRGRIAPEPRGSGGFGYDPIFIPDGYDQTFGELAPSIKQEISHRAVAFREIIPFLLDFIAV